ncbi:MAG: AmmeMemoRadiSam system radical SAM enzyme [Candidatus Omnitrophota bacterium]|nr:MAG: AmmeMemoRadiSam system radical SAM enzyme [Candidatus Omnitrophota bacterium]
MRFFLFFIFLSFQVTLLSQESLKEASFWQRKGDSFVQCLLCPRRCIIKEGKRGFCRVRVNRGGRLYTLAYNNPVAVAVDPIEKKPFFHVLPGTPALSIAFSGCNMRCIFCQNWHISQKAPDETQNYFLTSKDLIKLAKKYKCPSIVFTYTEPTIFYEYMLETAKLAKKEGLFVGMHTCGYINEEPLRKLLEYMDFVNVDLKAFSEEFYNKIGYGAHLSPILETLKTIKEAGVHLEITNLVIPTLNDSPSLIKKMCVWIKENLGDEVPLHFSRFYPMFKLRNLPPTSLDTLKEAYKIAKEVGLKYVYIGNVFGVKEESTFCPFCGRILIRRVGYTILENNIKDGKCRWCNHRIEGIWSSNGR